MHSSQFMGLMVVLGGSMATDIARAQQAPVAPAPVAPAQYAPPPVAPAQYAPAPVAPVPFAGTSNVEAVGRGATATGFMVQARMQAQSSLLSLGGGPGFLVGSHGPTFSLGIGLGLTRLGISSKDSGSTSASVSLVQIVPTLLVDVWHSADGRARANLVGGVGYERASASTTQDRQSCFFNPNNGTTMCSTSSATNTAGATLVPIMVGAGGDYFLSRNFSIGAEGGLQAAILTSVDSVSNSSSQSYNTTGDMEFAYGVIRATIVLGD